MATESRPALSKWERHVHHFDVDSYLNRFVPRPRMYILPKPIAHFFGYRPPDAAPAPAPSQPVIWLSACVGGFIGIALITAVYHALPMLGGQQVPVVIASFGAAAILEYNTIESPLSQPRNLILGHFLSALIGVAVTKGFERLPEARFDELQWLAGAISVGIASALMSMTKTVHPPAGATALLASTSHEVRVLNWWLLPLVLLASVLMVASALVVNNLTRRWPLYWWTPVDLSHRESKVKHVQDVEKCVDARRTSVVSDSTEVSHAKSAPKHIEDVALESNGVPTQTHSCAAHDASTNTFSNDLARRNLPSTSSEMRIIIGPDSIVLPEWMEADEWETKVLEIFLRKLHDKHYT